MFVFSGFPSYMIACFADWIEREQAEAIEYSQAENRILRGRLGSGESPRGGRHVLGRAFNAQDLLHLRSGLAPGPTVMTRAVVTLAGEKTWLPAVVRRRRRSRPKASLLRAKAVLSFSAGEATGRPVSRAGWTGERPGSYSCVGPAHAILARAQREFFGKLIPDRGGGLAVKKKQFKPEHIAAILQQLDLGMPVAAVTRRTGISEQTFHQWKKA